MSKRHKKRALPPVHAHKQASGAAGVEAFTFGDPVPVLDRRELLDYVECVRMDKWYEPPISFDGLARTFRATVHHSSPLYVKRNILTSTFKPHRLLSQQAFSRFVQDYLVFGNAYLELRTNRLGGPMELKPSLAKYTRRGVDLNTYWFVQYGLGLTLTSLTPIVCFTCWSLISTKRSTACQNICRRLTRHGSMNRPHCSAASITRTAVTLALSCI